VTPRNTAAWLHNSHIGHAVMMQKQAQTIRESKTATDEAKREAHLIYQHAIFLEQALRAGRMENPNG
jgi:hypothetical protein